MCRHIIMCGTDSRRHARTLTRHIEGYKCNNDLPSTSPYNQEPGIMYFYRGFVDLVVNTFQCIDMSGVITIAVETR